MRSEIHRQLAALAVAASLVALAACTPERDPGEFFVPDAVDLLVVDAVLVVDDFLPPVRLSRTLSPDAPYTLSDSGEQDALMEIRGGDGTVTVYENLDDGSGLYAPSRPRPRVQPSTEYELHVVTDRGEILTARTLTPARFAVERWVALDPVTGAELRQLRTFAELGDSVYAAPANQVPYASAIVEAQLGVVDEDAFQLALFSLDPDSPYVIDPPFFEEEDFEDLARTGSSPALVADNGNVRLPWFAIYYEGRYKYKIFAVDRNWFDLLRSTPQNSGGFGFGGTFGEGFETPIFRVEGGIGLFGSASADSTGFMVLQAQ